MNERASARDPNKRGLNRHVTAWQLMRQRKVHRHSPKAVRPNGPVTHVVILDGTMSTLEPGRETNAGLTWKLLASEKRRAHLSLWYEAGSQWSDWRATKQIISGGGTNGRIERAYGFLASRYRPGDRIFLFGYSRGAFSVRSLAGAIDRIGLLKAEHATERNTATAYRHYRHTPDSEAAAAFRRAYCHPDVQIEMIGVWDTVKALGLRLPLLWRLTEQHHAFHNHALGSHIKRGYQALAYDETRLAFEPELWESTPDRREEIEQRWFPGAHPDVGGQLSGHFDSRPLSNIPLVWILGRAEASGLPLPEGWRHRFPCDEDAPAVGNWSGWAKLFLLRGRRQVGRDPSETFDPSLMRSGRLDTARVAL